MGMRDIQSSSMGCSRHRQAVGRVTADQEHGFEFKVVEQPAVGRTSISTNTDPDECIFCVNDCH